MSIKTKLFLSAVATTLLPGVAFASCGGCLSALCQLADSAIALVGGTLPKLLFALALVYFFYGLISYVSGVDDKKKLEAKSTMIWGILVLFVMASVWGLIAFVQGATGISSGGSLSIPVIQ